MFLKYQDIYSLGMLGNKTWETLEPDRIWWGSSTNGVVETRAEGKTSQLKEGRDAGKRRNHMNKTRVDIG